MNPDWIAVDWGTSRLRAWAMEGTRAMAEASSDAGMGGLSREGFGPALDSLLSEWDPAPETPVIACGMVGARQGWVEAPYRAVPCAPVDGPFTRVRESARPVHIVPGLRQDRPAADVMRGEETQIAGFLALNPNFDGTLCLPGSHTKWVQVSAGEVISFQTAMTGELFAALRNHTVLSHTLTDDWDDATFVEAVADGMSRPEALAHRLFNLRARALLEEGVGAGATSRASGLLVGAELAHARPYWLGMPVAIIGAPALSARYGAALRAQAVEATVARDSACTLAGLSAARTILGGTT